jgi:hypothetical protein
MKKLLVIPEFQKTVFVGSAAHSATRSNGLLSGLFGRPALGWGNWPLGGIAGKASAPNELVGSVSAKIANKIEIYFLIDLASPAQKRSVFLITSNISPVPRE